MADERDRAFVLRCILEEGPRHHRVASYALLRLLAAVLAEVGGPEDAGSPVEGAPLAMRLPPSVAASSEDPEFPISLPTSMLRELLAPREAELAIECLREGPPHHALANAAMTWMIQAIHSRVRGKGT